MIYAMKTVNRANPMREYMPAHAKSMVNVSGRASGFWKIMTGSPF